MPNCDFYLNGKQHSISFNSYGPEITKISKIENFNFEEIFKKSMKEKAGKNKKWFSFKKKEFHKAEYCLIHEMGIGAVVFKNSCSEQLKFTFNLQGNNIQKCNFFQNKKKF